MLQNPGVILKLNINKVVTKFVRYRHKYIFSMDKAYLKYVDSTDVYHMNFHYTNSTLKVDRTFNFSRKITENVESFLSRISTNVEKVISKKLKRKRNDKEETSKIAVTAELFGNSGVIDKCATCQDVFKQDNLILIVLEKQYKIIKNCPWIDSISLSNVLLANYPVYPNKFEVTFTNKDLCEFIWYKSKDKKEWIQIGKGFLLQLSNNEINHYLKLQCIPKNDDLIGPLTEVISDAVVQASPGSCSFEIRHQFTKNKSTSKEFRVVTYNILADLYSDSDFSRNVLYPYCPAYALNIDYRKLLIIKELTGYNADIICLQEVDKKVYQNDLQPVFSNCGYQSDLCLKGGQVAEGLACFYNEKKFSLLERDSIIFSECLESSELFKEIWQVISKNEKLKERILARTTAIQVLALKSKQLNEVLLVANTHLYFHPDADHIRLLQGALAIKYIQSKKDKLEKELCTKVPVVFCGDFNSVPDCGIYQLYTTGSVPITCSDWNSNKEEAVENLSVSQPLKLASACGTPEYTNYTVGFKGCLDYIFYDTELLEVAEVIPLPSSENVNEHVALPSVIFPSDHISLVSVLKLK